MTRPKGLDDKSKALHAQGALNRHPERVTDPRFDQDEFFDPRDLVQVKYEMLRKVRKEGASVCQTASAFGFSRPSYYQAQSDFKREGLPGLLPRKRGPRGGYKLTPEIMEAIHALWKKDPSLRAQEFIEHVAERFGVAVHRRTMERALARVKKKPR